MFKYLKILHPSSCKLFGMFFLGGGILFLAVMSSFFFNIVCYDLQFINMTGKRCIYMAGT